MEKFRHIVVLIIAIIVSFLYTNYCVDSTKISDKVIQASEEKEIWKSVHRQCEEIQTLRKRVVLLEKLISQFKFEDTEWLRSYEVFAQWVNYTILRIEGFEIWDVRYFVYKKWKPNQYLGALKPNVSYDSMLDFLIHDDFWFIWELE